jgi:virginiamycin A acetyltransferase
MNPRLALKRSVQALAICFVLPAALLSGMGRSRAVFLVFAHLYSLAPGLIGMYVRAAYYKLTLRECSIDVSIDFGTVLNNPAACLAPHVSIGTFCGVGWVNIGRGTQIASRVEIPSGRRQHDRNADGSLREAVTRETVIGADCWIGASAVILEKVGDGSVIGAGAIVVSEIPPGSVAYGNPARVKSVNHA